MLTLKLVESTYKLVTYFPDINNSLSHGRGRTKGKGQGRSREKGHGKGDRQGKGNSKGRGETSPIRTKVGGEEMARETKATQENDKTEKSPKRRARTRENN